MHMPFRSNVFARVAQLSLTASSEAKSHWAAATVSIIDEGLYYHVADPFIDIEADRRHALWVVLEDVPVIRHILSSAPRSTETL